MDEDELYSLLSFLRSSEHRRKILGFLVEKSEPQTPTDIKEAIGIDRPHVSNRLGDLKEKGLVEVVNPDAKRFRYYRVTDKGKTVWGKL